MSEEIARTPVIRLKNTRVKCLKIRRLKSKTVCHKESSTEG